MTDLHVLVRRLGRRLPAPLRRPVDLVRHSRKLRRRLRPVRWGNLRRTRPISRRYGFDRGTPVDRWMLDRFVASHADVITGRVLEIGGDVFASRFGGSIESVDVLDIDPRNDRATLIADLGEPDCLPEAAFDCILLPQTLQYVSVPEVAVANLWRALAPGGTLLLTVPAVAKVDHDLVPIDSWRFLPPAVRLLVDRCCPGAESQVAAHGNVLTAVAFLLGVAAEELDHTELAEDDPLHPVLTCAVVRRPEDRW